LNIEGSPAGPAARQRRAIRLPRNGAMMIRFTSLPPFCEILRFAQDDEM
jgi:hypothetical protein